jgi:hypothetical protein
MIKKTGKEVSITTLWRSLRYCGITRKKVIIFIIILFIAFYMLNYSFII